MQCQAPCSSSSFILPRIVQEAGSIPACPHFSAQEVETLVDISIRKQRAEQASHIVPSLFSQDLHFASHPSSNSKQLLVVTSPDLWSSRWKIGSAHLRGSP